MELFHTSPEKIEKVNQYGLFGDCLCFADHPYFMTEVNAPVIYKLELDDSDVIEASMFFFHDDWEKLDGVVADVMELVGCDEDTAQELLSERTSVWEESENADADMAWSMQRMIGKAGKILVYRAVECRDEQGAMWLVSMSGHEHEMVEVI